MNGEDITPIIRRGHDRETEAATWHVRLTSGEASDAERGAFAAWAEDPENAAAFADFERLWEGIGPILAAPGNVVPLRRRFRMPQVSPRALAMAASLAIAVGLGFQYVTVWQFDHVTQGSARGTATLPDGSTVALNTGTALDIDYAGGMRRVRLARGEAFFDVKHDPAHPFVVGAGDGEVRVLGTAFSVRREGDGGVVMVKRGKVRVSTGGHWIDLLPGQRVRYAGGAEGPVAQVDVDAELAWSRGRLVFQDKPLGEAIAAIDRYYPGSIVLLDKAAASRRVNAVVDLNRIDDWLAALGRSQGVTVRRFPGFTLLG